MAKGKSSGQASIRMPAPRGQGCLCVLLTAVSPAPEEWLAHSRCSKQFLSEELNECLHGNHGFYGNILGLVTILSISSAKRSSSASHVCPSGVYHTPFLVRNADSVTLGPLSVPAGQSSALGSCLVS